MFQAEIAVLLVGGRENDKVKTSVLKYSITNKKDTTQTWMRMNRSAHQAVHLNGKIYIAGGKDENGKISNSFEIFNRKYSWSKSELFPNMITARQNFGMCQLGDDKLIVAGGEISEG